MEWGLAVFLIIMSAFDCREKSVPAILLIVGGVLSVLVAVYKGIIGENGWMQMVLGVLPGLFVLVTAWFSQNIGVADGIVLIMTGMCIGYRENVFVLGMSLFLISFLGVTLLLLHKVKRQTRIPYIPFLTAAYWLDCMLRFG